MAGGDGHDGDGAAGAIHLLVGVIEVYPSLSPMVSLVKTRIVDLRGGGAPASSPS